MVPGELLIEDGEHTLNPGRRTLSLVVQNASDRVVHGFRGLVNGKLDAGVKGKV